MPLRSFNARAIGHKHMQPGPPGLRTGWFLIFRPPAHRLDQDHQPQGDVHANGNHYAARTP